jgi:hypothetical protein
MSRPAREGILQTLSKFEVIGGLVRALIELSKETGKWDWADRVLLTASTLIVVAILQSHM